MRPAACRSVAPLPRLDRGAPRRTRPSRACRVRRHSVGGGETARKHRVLTQQTDCRPAFTETTDKTLEALFRRLAFEFALEACDVQFKCQCAAHHPEEFRRQAVSEHVRDGLRVERRGRVALSENLCALTHASASAPEERFDEIQQAGHWLRAQGFGERKVLAPRRRALRTSRRHVLREGPRQLGEPFGVGGAVRTRGGRPLAEEMPELVLTHPVERESLLPELVFVEWSLLAPTAQASLGWCFVEVVVV